MPRVLVCLRPGGVALFIACVATFAAPSMAHAVTPPTLQSPDAGASFAGGGAITFRWSGSLQGDSSAISRAYFMVQLALASDVPTDPQAEWTSLANYWPTQAGQQETSAQLGVPDTAGTYKWRVCAYGVADASAGDQIVQLPGGCSASRELVATDAADDGGTPGSMRVEHGKTVQAPDTTVTKPRPGVTPATPVQPPDKVVYRSDPTRAAASIDRPKDGAATFGSGGSGSSAVGIDDAGAKISGSSDGPAGAFSGMDSVSHALGASFPGVPIPFWSLGLLLLSLPMTWLWRRDTLSMFRFADDVGPPVPVQPLEELVKDRSEPADGPTVDESPPMAAA